MARLGGRKVLITQAGDFMGPALLWQFRQEGAEVKPSTIDLRRGGAAQAEIEAAGPIDILVINLMRRNRRNPVTAIDDEEWADMFDSMMRPLHELVRAVIPQMKARRRGKIVVIGSANGLRGSAPRSAYSAARGAQLSYVRSAGIEAAPLGININAIAQNWVENPTSYGPEVQAAPDFAARLAEVPVRRLAKGWESAALAVYLASDESDLFFGQIFPFSGGWAI
ncbi:MAG: SDR family oxidoreductase [Hyphomicrobiales bacterium]